MFKSERGSYFPTVISSVTYHFRTLQYLATECISENLIDITHVRFNARLHGYTGHHRNWAGMVFVELVSPRVVREFIDHSPDKDKSDANLSLDTAAETLERSELFNWKHPAASFHSFSAEVFLDHQVRQEHGPTKESSSTWKIKRHLSEQVKS